MDTPGLESLAIYFPILSGISGWDSLICFSSSCSYRVIDSIPFVSCARLHYPIESIVGIAQVAIHKTMFPRLTFSMLL